MPAGHVRQIHLAGHCRATPCWSTRTTSPCPTACGLGAEPGIAQAGALLADWIGSELLTRVSEPPQP
jgi:hypothetical protein